MQWLVKTVLVGSYRLYRVLDLAPTSRYNRLYLALVRVAASEVPVQQRTRVLVLVVG